MRKILIVTALLSGLVAASHAVTIAATGLNIGSDSTYDAGVYEFSTGDSSLVSFGNDVDAGSPYRGQAIVTSNAFDFATISLVYDNREIGAEVVTNMAVHIYEIADPLASSYDFQTTSTVVSATFDAPLTTENSTLVVLLGTNISLAADTSYMVLLDASGSGSQASFEWIRSTSTANNFYTNGNAFASDGSSVIDRDHLVAFGPTPPGEAFDDLYVLAGGLSSTNVSAPGVLENDISYDSAVLDTDITSGSLTLNADGSFDVSGLADGTNSFTYSMVSGAVTSAPATVILIATLSETPATVVDDAFQMDLGWDESVIVGNVLGNDTNNSVIYAISALLETDVASGTLSITNNGDFTYTPNPGFEGIDSFTYTAITPLATSAVATVTLSVTNIGPAGVLIESFNTYDNTITEVRDNGAATNWDPDGSGTVDIIDNPLNLNDQYLYVNLNSGQRGCFSKPALFSGIADSSTEYWLYWEMKVDDDIGVGSFGLSTSVTPVVGDFSDVTLGVQVNVSNSTLSAHTTSGSLTSLTTVARDTWYGIWLDVNNAANTYDVYVGAAGDSSVLGTLVGTDIPFDGGTAELSTLIATGYRDLYIDNIINLPNTSPPSSNNPAIISGAGFAPAAFDTMMLTIGLDSGSVASDYWPESTDSLVVTNWVPVAHSDAPDGTFSVTNLNVASGDETNKVIYIKATNSVDFLRIMNNP